MEEQLKSKFDLFYAKNDPWNTQDSTNQFLYAGFVKLFLNKKRFINVLDLGCGNGFLTNLLIQRCSNVTGIDISSNAIQYAKMNTNGNVTFIVSGAIRYLQGVHQKYDLITCFEMLYYLEEKDQILLLNEIRNHLSENGVFILGSVTSGPNTYGKYFTPETIQILLSDNFMIQESYAVTPSSFRKAPLIRSSLILLKYLRLQYIASYLVTHFLSMRKAYQSVFILKVKK
jgi:2-polyprenyl-3-methyl-5-hydroxy-6-metoxy-1,4-benzoquinol methylase